MSKNEEVYIDASVILVEGVQGEPGKDADESVIIEKVLKKISKPKDGTPGKKGEKGDKGERGEKGAGGKDGVDGKDGTDGKHGKDGNDGSPDTPDQVVDKVNESTKKIKSKQIEGLPALIDEVSKIGTNPSGYASGGANQISYTANDTRISSHVTQLDFGTGISAAYSNNGKISITVTGAAPIGTVVAWHKSFTNTPTLATGWVECSGQVLSNTSSVYNGQTIPNLNGASSATPRFIRGALTSGTTGGAETHSHTNTAAGGHLHLIAGSTSYEDNHTHCFSGLTTDIGGNHSHSYSGTTSGDGAHSHALSGACTDTAGDHTHSLTMVGGTACGNTDAPSATTMVDNSLAGSTVAVASDTHCHAFSGSIALTGSTDSAGSHCHNVTGYTDTSTCHSHTYGGSTDSGGDHTHGLSMGNTDGSGGHCHGVNFNSSFVSDHNHTMSSASSLPSYFSMVWIMRVV